MTEHSTDRIVVGVDESAASDAAIRWAAREAAMRNVTLTLLYAVNPAEQAWRVGYAKAPLPPAHGELQREEGQRVLESARRIADAAVAADQAIRVDTELSLAVPIPTLIDATKDAQLIVVGSRGRSAWRRGLFGSVSTALIHHSHCPVAVIREPADEIGEGRGPVVVGIDGSPASELATAVAFDEASRRGAELVAIHAWIDSEPPGLPSLAWPEFKSAAEETLAERLAGWSDRYPDVAVHRRVVFDQPARHLLEAGEAAQLLVVGSHGRGGFAGMLLGSVSTTVVHATSTPVIVCRQN